MTDETTVHEWHDKDKPTTEPTNPVHPEAGVETEAQPFDPIKPGIRKPCYKIDLGLFPLNGADAAAHRESWKALPRTFRSWEEIEGAVLRLLKLYFEQNSEVAIKLRKASK